MPNADSLAVAARSNDYLSRALNALPGYREAIELRAKVVQAQRELRGIPPVESPTTADGLDDFLDAVGRAEIDRAVFEAQRGALASLRGELDSRITSLTQRHSNAALTVLADAFADLLADVNRVAEELDGARTAAEAIANGTEDAWRRLSDLRQQYDQLRAAQQSIVMSAFGQDLLLSSRSRYIEDELASDFVLNDLDRLIPGWKRADARFTLGGKPFEDRRPWPDEPLAQLLWLAASGAAWLPTAAQLRALHAARAARLNQAKAEANGNAERPTQTGESGRKHDRIATTLRTVDRAPVDID